MQTTDISWTGLFLGSLILIIPFSVLWYYRTGMVRALLWAFVRMAIQLSLVGIYLRYIFEINSIVLNLAWVVLMIVAASFTISKRSNLRPKKFFMPLVIGILAGLVTNAVIFDLVVLGNDSFLNARYLIPIAGMIIGNCLTGAIVGTRSFYQSLSKDEDRYMYYLACGAARSEALFPFIRDSLKDAFSPQIASTAAIGLIWLPGMMTGQILGGSSPLTAIKYQILIMIAIFAAGVLTVWLSIILSKSSAFDELEMLDRGVFRE
jgi:putative ABC transport system permease protein